MTSRVGEIVANYANKITTQKKRHKEKLIETFDEELWISKKNDIHSISLFDIRLFIINFTIKSMISLKSPQRARRQPQKSKLAKAF